MARIIQELPYFSRPTSVEIRGRLLPVKRDQIIVWVSVADRGGDQLDPHTPRIPAILDTGCNVSATERRNRNSRTVFGRFHRRPQTKVAKLLRRRTVAGCGQSIGRSGHAH